MTSLLDGITTAKGDASANYLGKGRHIVKITRLVWREETPELAAQFRIDAQLMHTNGDTKQLGTIVTANVNFGRVKSSSLANVRRLCRVIQETISGKPTTEGHVTPAVVNALVGPDQPAVGALIIVNGIEKANKETGKPYTTYECMTLNADDVALMTQAVQ